jgi:hypothetical protein
MLEQGLLACFVPWTPWHSDETYGSILRKTYTNAELEIHTYRIYIYVKIVLGTWSSIVVRVLSY